MIRLLISPIGFHLKQFEIEINPLESGLHLYNEVANFCAEHQIKLLFKGRNISLEKSLQESGLVSGGKVIMSKSDEKKSLLENSKITSLPRTELANEAELQADVIMEPKASEPEPVNQPRPRQNFVENILCSESTVSNVFIWGSNSCGKLGVDNVDNIHTPFTVRLRNNIEVVACGSCHTVALDSDGKLFYWGRGLYPKDNVSRFSNKAEPCEMEIVKGTRFANVVAGSGHSLALDSRGNIWSWGEGIHGQLGHGVLDNEFYPRLIESIQGMRFASIAAGGQHSIGLLTTGESIIWGKNQGGQLGTGDKIDRILPSILLDFKASEVKCGILHTAWRRNNEIYVSGNSSDKPRLALENVRLYDCGGYNTHAITLDNQFVTFTSEGEIISEKSLNVAKLISSESVVFLILEDGRLIAKGDNKQGQLGVGDTAYKHEWTNVRVPTAVKSFACSHSHACAITDSYTLASNLSNAFKLDWKDTEISCSNGIIKAHKILLSVHTHPAQIFDTQDSHFNTSVSTRCAEVIVIWLYSGKLEDNLDKDELLNFYQLAKSRNVEKLAEQIKQRIDERESDRYYALNFSESIAASALAKMAQAERKALAERIKSNPRAIDEPLDEALDFRASSESNEDENQELEEFVDAQEETQMIIDTSIVTPEEKRRRMLEALEKRLNQ